MKFIYIWLFILNAHGGLIIKDEDISACSKYVNLQRQGWFKQRNVPTLDQGPVGLCYANAAVTLLDMWREMHGLRISRNIALSDPQYAAFLYKMEFDKFDSKMSLDAGMGDKTLEAIKKYGMCRDDVLQFSMREFSRSHKISTKDWYAVTEWFLEFFDTSIKNEIEKAPNKAEKLKEIFSRYKYRERVNSVFLHGDFEKIYESLRPYLLNKDYIGYVKNVFGQCFKKENIYLGTLNIPDVVKSKNPFKFMSTINSNLDQKNPVGVAYAHQILRGGGGKFKKIKYFLLGRDHESVLIGKRVRNGKCQYLLKNTWGNYCKYAWECQKSPDGGEVGAWIDADYFLPALKGIYYFKHSNK